MSAGFRTEHLLGGAIPKPNPRGRGACPECGNYRTDGRPPYLHRPGCSREGDLQLDRFFAEMATGDHGGPTLYEDESSVARARELGVREAATYDDVEDR
jgi:hypothetical protein